MHLGKGELTSSKRLEESGSERLKKSQMGFFLQRTFLEICKGHKKKRFSLLFILLIDVDNIYFAYHNVHRNNNP